MPIETPSGQAGASASPAVSARDDSARDRVFAVEQAAIADFAFGQAVAAAFDDMVGRSVPFYSEIQRMTLELCADFAIPGTTLADLGCSTGTTLLALDAVLPPGVRFLGVDNSDEMLRRTRGRLARLSEGRQLELRNVDLNEGIALGNASVGIMLLTLQFIRPLRRAQLMADLHAGLNDQGALILVEKVLGEESLFNRLFIKYYYDMKKRHGYSELEIAQKREALENVLVPYRLPENRELLLQAGFRYVDVFFKWYNFCGIVAVK